jgi:CDP-diacylglycerol--glycerol-3-phosphate 3-phosphatidyltransferase
VALYDVKPRFRALLQGLVPALRPVHPDWITLAGLACSVLAAALFQAAGQRRWLFLVIPLLLLLRITLNALDGMVAQATGKARPFGEVLNEVTDRLSDVAILLGLAMSPLSSLPFGTTAVVAVLLSSYVGVLGKAVGAGRQYGGILGKADRMLYLGLACIAAFFAGNPPLFRAFGAPLTLFDCVLAAFTLLALITAVHRVTAIHRALTPRARA